jgi:hypothetical protein
MCVSGISEAPVASQASGVICVLVVLVKRLSQARQADSHMCVNVASQASGQSYIYMCVCVSVASQASLTVICVLVVLVSTSF